MKNRRFTDAEKQKAQYYYLLGLDLEEISILTKAKVRTLKHWQNKYEWKTHSRREGFKKNLLKMKREGLTLKELNEKTGLSASTLHRYLKEAEKLENEVIENRQKIEMEKIERWSNEEN